MGFGWAPEPLEPLLLSEIGKAILCRAFGGGDESGLQSGAGLNAWEPQMSMFVASARVAHRLQELRGTTRTAGPPATGNIH